MDANTKQALSILKDILKSEGKLEDFIRNTVVYRSRTGRDNTNTTPAHAIISTAFTWPAEGNWLQTSVTYHNALPNGILYMRISWEDTLKYLVTNKSPIAFARRKYNELTENGL